MPSPPSLVFIQLETRIEIILISYLFLGLCFSKPIEGLIQHDITDSEATIQLIKQIKPNLGN